MEPHPTRARDEYGRGTRAGDLGEEARRRAADGRRPGRKHGGQGQAQGRLGLAREDPLGARQRGEQLGLGDQELREQIAARADLDEAEEQIRILDQQLDESRPGPGRREEPLELVQRLVRVGALPERVEEHRVEPLERGGEVRRIRHQRATFQDELQIVSCPLRVLEPGRPQRREARQPGPRARPELTNGEERPEGPVHGGRDGPVARPELFRGTRRRRLDADAPGQASELERLVRQRVRLELVQDLQAVLDRSQVHVGSREEPTEVGRQVSTFGEPEDRFQGVRLTQPRVVAPVEELQRLDDELDLADPAPSELDVGRLVTLGADGAVDLRLHRADGRDDPRVEPGPIHGPARQLSEAGADTRIAGGDPRFDERLALPQLGALPIVFAIPVERQDDAAHPPLGAQAQIDAERIAFVGDRLEQRDELPADAREVLAVGQASGATAGRLAVGAVDEHQVDVGRVVELVAAELAHGDDREPGLGSAAADRGAVGLTHGRLRLAQRLRDARVGQVRQLLGGPRQVGVAQEIADADAQEMAVLEAPQRVHPRLARFEWAERLRQVGRQVLGEPEAHRGGLEQPRQVARTPPQRVGEHLARAVEARQERYGAGVLGERAEEHRPVDGRGVALEVVERHVRVGRRRELGQETWQRRRQELRVAGRQREALEVRRRRGWIREPELPQRPPPASRRAAAAGGQKLAGPRFQTADSPVSPVRMRTDSLIGSTNTLPSPMEPVFAAPVMVSTTFFTRLSGTTTSIFTLGRKSTVYSEPR